MADPFIAIGLNAVPPMVNNYHKAWHPIKRQAKKVPTFGRSRNGTNDKDYAAEDMTPEQRGWVLKPRREVGSDEEIMQYVGRKGGQSQGNEMVLRRPGGAMVRRTSSLDRGSRTYNWAKGGKSHTQPIYFFLGNVTNKFRCCRWCGWRCFWTI